AGGNPCAGRCRLARACGCTQQGERQFQALIEPGKERFAPHQSGARMWYGELGTQQFRVLAWQCVLKLPHALLCFPSSCYSLRDPSRPFQHCIIAPQRFPYSPTFRTELSKSRVRELEHLQRVIENKRTTHWSALSG